MLKNLLSLLRTCRTGERIAFNYLISQKYTGEHAELEVLREGRPVALRVPLDRPHALVPLHLGGAQPSYLVVAGVLSLGMSSACLHVSCHMYHGKVFASSCWSFPLSSVPALQNFSLYACA